jgi:uncharacterized phiE125 gp8 family phage protein
MPLDLVTAPTSEPVSLADAKHHLRVDITEDDDYIRGLVTGVRLHVERVILQRALITQTWDLYLDAFPAGDLELPYPPVQSVTHVKYTAEGEAQATVSSDDYLVDTYSTPGKIRLQSTAVWPGDTLIEVNGVVVRFIAGYGDDDTDVPMTIRQAILLLVGDLYENRENTLIGVPGSLQVLPFAAQALLANERAKVGMY